MEKLKLYNILKWSLAIVGGIIWLTSGSIMFRGGDMYTCLVDKSCMLFRMILVLSLISLANHFFFRADVLSKKGVLLELQRGIVGHVFIVAMFLGYAGWIIYANLAKLQMLYGNGRLMACLLDKTCFMAEGVAILILVSAAGAFIILMRDYIMEAKKFSTSTPASKPQNGA